jgi:hypothetical protein
MNANRAASCAAILVAAATLAAGIQWGSTVGGGADSFGYLSQASLWRTGHLSIQSPIARQSPWPLALDTWAPLGYRAAPGSRDTIVPLYPPGLPLLMAAFQLAAGFCAAFLVVPLCGALTIWLTYVLGRRLGIAPWGAAAAAALLATSPIFLYQLMNPMSDVPVTAFWTLAAALAAGGWLLAAGMAAAVAVLIRPNLLLIAASLLIWIAATRQSPLRFAVGILPAIIAVAAINSLLYGAPWMSGYGAVGDLYSVGHLATNVRQFSAWTFETQTPIVLLALWPLGMRWSAPNTAVPRPRLFAGLLVAAVPLSYVFYIPFDAWWYLRFLLPMWPIVMLLMVAAIGDLFASNGSLSRAAWARWAAWAAVLLLAWNGVRVATARSAFQLSRGERRYVDVARFIASHTDAGAVIISLQHSGSVRLYGGRLTLRFDQLDPMWLDRAVAFLADRGRHPYVVLEQGELNTFRRRFGGSETGRLDWRPFAVLRDASLMFDAVNRTAAGEPLAIAAVASRRTGWRCDRPYDARIPLRSE